MSLESAALRTPRSTLALVRSFQDIHEEQEQEAADRRTSQRLALSELSWLNEVRLKYGPTVSLIDLSSSGAQIETTSYKLQPGTDVVVEIAGGEGAFAIPARVLRCQVSGLAPHATYRGALLFKQRFNLPNVPSNEDPGGDANLFREHARLSLALRRLRSGKSGSLSIEQGESMVTVGADALAVTRAMIESPAARRAGAPFTRALNRLFRVITRGIDSGVSSNVLAVQIAEHLRRSVPARSIRLVGADETVRTPNGDAIYFDVPPASGEPAAKLVVEFSRTGRLEQWHLQFLRVAAQLMTLTSEVERIHQSPEEPASTQKAAPVDPPGWNRVAVRYTDGRLFKGYCRDFIPARGHIHVWPTPDGPAQTCITVPITHLKAVFFVQDLNGAPVAVVEKPTQVVASSGRRIIVTFLDDEVLEGTTLNYTTNGPGFFVMPTDLKNNLKVFVASGAVRHVQFP
jgi:hypothetical protein